ncbi:unnamed protein product [Ectocarpus sp. 13 AM-2016]
MVATMLNSRALFLDKQGKHAEAEPLYIRAIDTLAPDHPDFPVWLGNRASLLEKRGNDSKANRLFLRAIKIGEKTLGSDHPQLAAMLNNRAVLLQKRVRCDCCCHETCTGDLWMLDSGREYSLL